MSGSAGNWIFADFAASNSFSNFEISSFMRPYAACDSLSFGLYSASASGLAYANCSCNFSIYSLYSSAFFFNHFSLSSLSSGWSASDGAFPILKGSCSSVLVGRDSATILSISSSVKVLALELLIISSAFLITFKRMSESLCDRIEDSP